MEQILSVIVEHPVEVISSAVVFAILVGLIMKKLGYLTGVGEEKCPNAECRTKLLETATENKTKLSLMELELGVIKQALVNIGVDVAFIKGKMSSDRLER